MVDSSEEISVEDALAMLIASNDEQQVLVCLETLEKLINNILSKPMEDKFRLLKITNATIIAKIYSL